MKRKRTAWARRKKRSKKTKQAEEGGKSSLFTVELFIFLYGNEVSGKAMK